MYCLMQDSCKIHKQVPTFCTLIKLSTGPQCQRLIIAICLTCIYLVLFLNDFHGMNHPVIQLHPRCGFYWAITSTMAANGEHVSVASAVRSFSSMLSSVQFVSALLLLLLLRCLVRNCDACRSTSENSIRGQRKSWGPGGSGWIDLIAIEI